jgi:hypothetical protein
MHFLGARIAVQVGVGLFWPGICIAKRLGVDVSGETAE